MHIRGFAKRTLHLIVASAAFVLSFCEQGLAASPTALKCGIETSVVPLPDPVSGRRYQLYVSLPPGFDRNSPLKHPLLVMADGGRAFPLHICEIRKLASANRKDLVVVALGYNEGETLDDSRRRDYTPTKQPSTGHTYGGSAAYEKYVRDVVIPYAESNYHTDPGKRIYWGHSYGGLFGATILLSDTRLFQTYILGSPSLWYDRHVISDMEATFAAAHTSLPARVFMYVGEDEVRRYDPGRKGDTQDMVKDAREFEERLRSRNYSGLTTMFEVLSGKDHKTSVGPGIAWGLGHAL